jgi:hypothetical protein
MNDQTKECPECRGSGNNSNMQPPRPSTKCSNISPAPTTGVDYGH